ncbi:hypothetical protein ElyMa_006921400 [Elysia marginata]|uniref:Uncharacterized protein n=1 Tax=Elysia marginata TaxID=1093978 RepID=A0AAV4JGC5_9GAST|nr:hypothetical protein ElyMa_006921400 [Elysia marginata]
MADSLVPARRFSIILYIQEIMRSQSEAAIPLGRLFGQPEAGVPLARITLGKRGESLAPQTAVTEAPLFPKVIRASGIPASDWPKCRPSGIPASDWLLKAHQATTPNEPQSYEALGCPQRASEQELMIQ